MTQRFYTIGYEGLTIERFLSALSQLNISTLVDVRDRAQSRKKGFSKTLLSRALADRGIGYVHLKSLGDPKAGREAARAGRMAEFKDIFQEVMGTVAAQNGLAQMLEIGSTGQACLLCYERDAELCHRSIVLSVASRSVELIQVDILVGEDDIVTQTQRFLPDSIQSIAA
ncbi:MAG: hypothetical protein RLZZ157_492 [Pseudomonadota bacterium]|jgi:uncharacterized protein (DUF488 family)